MLSLGSGWREAALGSPGSCYGVSSGCCPQGSCEAVSKRSRSILEAGTGCARRWPALCARSQRMDRPIRTREQRQMEAASKAILRPCRSEEKLLPARGGPTGHHGKAPRENGRPLRTRRAWKRLTKGLQGIFGRPKRRHSYSVRPTSLNPARNP